MTKRKINSNDPFPKREYNKSKDVYDRTTKKLINRSVVKEYTEGRYEFCKILCSYEIKLDPIKALSAIVNYLGKPKGELVSESI